MQAHDILCQMPAFKHCHEADHLGHGHPCEGVGYGLSCSTAQKLEGFYLANPIRRCHAHNGGHRGLGEVAAIPRHNKCASCDAQEQ